MMYDRLHRLSVRLTLFLKRKRDTAKFTRLPLRELRRLLQKPDPETIDLLWIAFCHKVCDLRDLMVVVYDDHQKFPQFVREFAGIHALSLISRTYGQRYLPDSPWFSTTHGRSAYLAGIALYLPQLKNEIRMAYGTLFPFERESLRNVISPDRRRLSNYAIA